MSKKRKKEMSITESVGDTSGFSEETPKFDKKRKITLFAGLGGIVVLIVLSIIFISIPYQVYFNNRYSGSPSNEVRYLDRKTKKLETGMDDPTTDYYVFGGWYLNENCTNPANGLFNNEDNHSLMDYVFTSRKKTTYLYAKWIAKEYTVTYNVKGTGSYAANINDQRVESLKTLNAAQNPASYTIKRNLQDYEINDYINALIKSNPEKYNNQNSVTEAQEKYEQDMIMSEIQLKGLTLDGWKFEGWYDNPEYTGNPITIISRTDPKNLTLYAKWTK